MTLGMTSESQDSTGEGTTTAPTDSGTTDDSASADSSSGPAPDMGVVEPGCGDAEVLGDEQCDDGNDDPCDGCEGCLRRTGLVLDGSEGTFAQVGDVEGAPLALLDTPLTVEAWMRVEDGERVELMRRGAGNAGWRMSLRSDSVVATVFNGFDHITDPLAIDAGWHHVAWTYDQVVSRLYLDGTEVGTMDGIDPVLETDAPLRIGAQVSGDGTIAGYVAGRIDELRVSTVIRYIGPFEPAIRHEPDGATVLLLHLDEGEGTEMFDASSLLHPATGSGVAWEPYDGYGGCGP